ncbi:hypothetical protein [Paenibacillus campi]|uniref:hypothetical protein n=1 Tax=Paenibacillus campi TaxID=3106031 RepID=UPI002AFFE0DA|nr:hypothetical protein [Paenibacillus sp. SGZ-1014]
MVNSKEESRILEVDKSNIGFIKFDYPFVVRDAMNDWEITKLWDFKYFSENFGEEIVFITNADSTKSYEVTLKDYIKYIITNVEDEEPLYLRDWNYFNNSKLKKQFNRKVYFVDDYLSELTDDVFPTLKWIYIGPINSYTPPHIDTLKTHAWNALFVGIKKWTFFKKDFIDSDEKDDFKKETIVYFQKPGEVVFTPSNYLHSVENITSSIALTSNFVNEHNIRAFLSDLITSLKGGD